MMPSGQDARENRFQTRLRTSTVGAGAADGPVSAGCIVGSYAFGVSPLHPKELVITMSNRKIDKLVADIRDGNVTIDDIDLDKEEFYVDGERLTEERADQITADVLARVRPRLIAQVAADGVHARL
ncbi:hypothetical protein ACAG26_14850 [Mycobacterium sp. pUA109]|uniref:hypothetical protein n=1 Tax=Mycobacterium sp. pUA109 TaxID=3238982 RepID=UPI00351ADB3F